MARIPLDKWIEQSLNDKHKDGPCTSLSVVHKEGSTEKEVHSIVLSEGSKIDSKELAELFHRKAEQHVQELPGSQLFFVYARYGGRIEPEARLPFRVSGSMELTHGETEAPTAEGQRAQAMRQNEFGHQFWAKQIIEVFGVMQKNMTSMAHHNEMLTRENRDYVEVFKNVIFEQARNNHTYEMEKLKFLQQSQLIENALKLGPAILNTLTGKEIVPQSTADTALLEAMIENMTPEQAQDVVSRLNLPQSVIALLMARAKDHWEKKLNAERNAALAVQNRNDPTLDVEGTGVSGGQSSRQASNGARKESPS